MITTATGEMFGGFIGICKNETKDHVTLVPANKDQLENMGDSARTLVTMGGNVGVVFSNTTISKNKVLYILSLEDINEELFTYVTEQNEETEV